MKKIICLLLLPICFINLMNCSKSTEPEPEVELPGVWSDSSTTFHFNDSTWVWGLNHGEVEATDETQGTMLLDGVPFGTYTIEGDKLIIHIIPDDKEFTLTQTSTVALDSETLSLITRRGNYIAFASNRPSGPDNPGDELGDIFIYTVDTNANLDTVFYYSLTITQRDTVINNVDTTVADSELVSNYIEPIRRLTDNPGLDENPSWSPDGSKLAFISDRSGIPAVWVYFMDDFANPDSSVTTNPMQLTNPGSDLGDANPTWSPDGAFVAFERRDEANSTDNLRDVYIIPSGDYGDESNLYNFTHAPENDCFNPEWSGLLVRNIILFEQRQNGTSSDWDVFWLEATDSSGFDLDDKTHKVTNPNRNGHPTWSPDGQMVAFERNPPGSEDKYDINIQSLDILNDSTIDSTSGINPTALTTQTEFVGLNRYPTWLPNGNLIAFMRMDDIWLIDISAGIDNPTHRKLLEDDFRNWDIAW